MVHVRWGCWDGWQMAGSPVALTRHLNAFPRCSSVSTSLLWWLVVNLANIYSELDGRHEPVNPLEAFGQMAELAN